MTDCKKVQDPGKFYVGAASNTDIKLPASLRNLLLHFGWQHRDTTIFAFDAEDDILIVTRNNDAREKAILMMNLGKKELTR